MTSRDSKHSVINIGEIKMSSTYKANLTHRAITAK